MSDIGNKRDNIIIEVNIRSVFVSTSGKYYRFNLIGARSRDSVVMSSNLIEENKTISLV